MLAPDCGLCDLWLGRLAFEMVSGLPMAMPAWENEYMTMDLLLDAQFARGDRADEPEGLDRTSCQLRSARPTLSRQRSLHAVLASRGEGIASIRSLLYVYRVMDVDRSV